MQSEPPGAETHEPVFPTKQRSLCLRCDDTGGRPIIVNGDRRLTRAAECRVRVPARPARSSQIRLDEISDRNFAAAGDR